MVPSDSKARPLLPRLNETLRERLTTGATAVITEERAWTYAELADAVALRARALTTHGVNAGDRVVALLSAGVNAIAWNLACYARGAVFVPVNSRYQAAEISHITGDCRPRLLVYEAAFADVIDEVCATSSPPPRRLEWEEGTSIEGAAPHDVARGFNLPDHEDNLALLIYTSGTTGRSKGVMLEHGAVLRNMGALTDAWGFNGDDQLVLALPLFHVHGLCIGVHGGLLHGLTLRLLPRFSPPAVVASLRAGGTVFMGVPTMYARLVEHLRAHPEDADAFRSARLFTAGSAALSPQLFREFERLTGHRILERYGMSETLITLSNPLHGDRRPGTVGFPVSGVKVRVRDDNGELVAPGVPGELEVRSDGMMRGYWGRDPWQATAWFATGDIVTRDVDGYLSIVGRKSVDIIKSGGFKIAAREIEEVLRSHPSVQEVAVVGVPHEIWGEQIVAFVEGPAAPGLGEALTQLCKTSLAHYKCPKEFQFVDALPRNALGKLQKHLLKRTYTPEVVPR